MVENTEAAKLSGSSLIGGTAAHRSPEQFRAVNPENGSELEPAFCSASHGQISEAATLAAAAFTRFSRVAGKDRGALLRGISGKLANAAEAIVARAHLETGLPLPRLQGELGRTTGQLNLFASVLEEGSWVDARIDEADPERKPLPRPDIRSMLLPLGPVAVFGASNFPLAFSVAGGDTASALASGNPVIVKAHPAHPGTSEIVGSLIQQAVREAGLHPGVFALLFDAGVEVGRALVQHPLVKAVAFTGSATAGQALMRLCSGRPVPIPCYAEMGSTNPLFILPGAMRERAATLAQGLQGSITLGSGQFCTKPGLVFLPQNESDSFVEALGSGVAALGQHRMLTAGIAAKYAGSVEERLADGRVQWIGGNRQKVESGLAASHAAVFSVPLPEFLQRPDLEEEIFGPTTLLVHYGDKSELIEAAKRLHGHLTATLHATEDDLANATDLIAALESKVGRILFNGYPTGVEVCSAMVHGGPFPATSDGRSTSVGTRAMLRFTRAVCYQDFPDKALPPELQRANPLGIMRLVNGALNRDKQT